MNPPTIKMRHVKTGEVTEFEFQIIEGVVNVRFGIKGYQAANNSCFLTALQGNNGYWKIVDTPKKNCEKLMQLLAAEAL
jgi:hypothetical protein